jgi:hypothetical protein
MDSQKGNANIPKDKLYEEIGHHYRFFLSWRNATVAALIIILYFGSSLYFDLQQKGITQAYFVPIAVILIIALLWISEYRTRDLYHAAQNAGKDLEKPYTGIYLAYENYAIPKFSQRKRQPYKIGASCISVGSPNI